MKFLDGMTTALAIRTARKRNETRFGPLLAAVNNQRSSWYKRETGGVPNYAWVGLGVIVIVALVHYCIYPPF